MNENLISNHILQELELVLGSSLSAKKWEPVSVPKLLSYSREFAMLESQDGGSKFLLVKEQSSQDWNITAIQKQYSILSEAAGDVPVVFLLSELTSARKASYLRHRIPYITMNNQYFLPFAAYKSDGKYAAEVPDKNQFTPAAQMLFLYFMYSDNQKNMPLSKSQAAKAIGMSLSSLTRASRQLENFG